MNMPLFGIMAASGGGTTPAVTPVTVAAWKSLFDVLTAQISSDTIIPVIAATVASAIGMVFAWWGMRKLAKVLMAAFRNGKLRVG